MLARRHLLCATGIVLLTACSAGSNSDSETCQPNDQDGIVGSNVTVLLSVSDTGFAVGGVNSGSMQPNVAVQNTSTVKLTISNVGSRPHSFRVGCRPTELPASCPQMSCFPDTANVPALEPGERATVTFETPAVEGEYPFTSDEPGDEALLGQFVLL